MNSKNDPDHELRTCLQDLIRERASLRGLVADLTAALVRARRALTTSDPEDEPRRDAEAVEIAREQARACLARRVDELEALAERRDRFVADLADVLGIDRVALGRHAAIRGEAILDAILKAIRAPRAAIRHDDDDDLLSRVIYHASGDADESASRREALRSVLRHGLALAEARLGRGAASRLVDKLESLEDRKGILIARWRRQPCETEKDIIAEAWAEIRQEPANHVRHDEEANR